MSFKASILVDQKKPLLIEKIELPDRLEYGQVLIEVEFASICGSQIDEVNGVKGEDRFLPHLLGHEGAGKVVERGPGTKKVRVGDYVVLHWMKGSGIEAETPKYRRGRNGYVNAGLVTTFNRYAVVSENRMTPISKDFDLSLAPLLGCAVTTGFGIVVNNARLGPAESIIVFGAGGIGLNVIQVASLVSAYPITAVDRSDLKLSKAVDFGATETINTCVLEPYEIVQLGLYDAAVDTTGEPYLIELAYTVTKPRGRTVMAGVPKGNVSIYPLPLFFGKALTGSHGGEIDPDEDIPRCIRLYEQGKLKLKELITDEFSLDEINMAIEKMKKGEILGKCLIRLG